MNTIGLLLPPYKRDKCMRPGRPRSNTTDECAGLPVCVHTSMQPTVEYRVISTKTLRKT